MFNSLLKKLFGSRNERIIKQLQQTVEQTNKLENSYQQLSDQQLADKTDEFRLRLQQGSSLDDLLVEAFATIREVAKRCLGLRHYDVQIMGGIALHKGNISEMQTGEGKTLVATLPAYLNALSGNGVHIVTVNDYLAKRDADWMRPIYEFMGLKVGVVVANMPIEERQQAYQADITYGTNNEFGFDYLRDNMAFAVTEKVQPQKLNYAIIDEVDSILIDEARTPLIISGAASEDTSVYDKINTLVAKFTEQKVDPEAENNKYMREEPEYTGHFIINEKDKRINLTECGQEYAEELLTNKNILKNGESLFHVSNIRLVHHINTALRAHKLFHKDVDYIVQNNQIVIIDEHTGRAMAGRRWSDGLHQAIEAKEGVKIQQESQTLASITIQNYFRLYKKLGGMTGTADTEAAEFQQIYSLEVVIIPPNIDSKRKDSDDQIFLTRQEKFDAVIEEIKTCLEKQCPVLVGTASIDVSTYLASRLKKEKINHQVLNAKYHEKEAQIIAQAGVPGTVTIATNMAGRGTDIVLGGNLDEKVKKAKKNEKKIEQIKQQWQQDNKQVIEAGGLHIIGTERHESRRIDNQLRGRAGRQGDPGVTKFYLSLEDDLIRIFSSERMPMLMKKLGMGKGEAIEHPWVNRAIEHAQRKVEAHNYEMRKQLLEFDDISNEQRKIIYQHRNDLLASDAIDKTIDRFFADVAQQIVSNINYENSSLEVIVASLVEELKQFGINNVQKWFEGNQTVNEISLIKYVTDALRDNHKITKRDVLGEEISRQLEKGVMIQLFDQHWREHLAAMDYLLKGISLRSFAQKNPKQEYKRESFEMFSKMIESLKYDVVNTLAKIVISHKDDGEDLVQSSKPRDISYQHAEANNVKQEQMNNTNNKPFVNSNKIGRNELCSCGSKKKYKHCHGKGI